MNLLIMFFRAASLILFCLGLYFLVGEKRFRQRFWKRFWKRFWFPVFPMLAFSLAFARAAEKEWQRLFIEIVVLSVLYLSWTAVLIFLKRLKRKK